MDGFSRRHLLGAAGAAGLALAGGSAQAQGTSRQGPSPVDRGRVEGGGLHFDPVQDPRTEAGEEPTPRPLPPAERVGFAIVGLGRLSLNQILPAFGSCKYAKPAALVSGDRDKMRLVGHQYGIPESSLYGYDTFDRIADNPDVKVVYVVLPNSMHHEFVLRAAKAGKHVICEKPMANTSAEAREMIAACAGANVRLMIAYRCQYEPHNRALIRMARTGEYGPPKLIEASNGQNQELNDQWRLKKGLAGGGALPDIGLYCLNATRYLTGEEPVEVQAQVHSTPGDPRFREVEEAVTFLLRYPSGVLAHCAASYGIHQTKPLRLHTPQAMITLENAFAYKGQRLRVARLQDGVEADSMLRIGEKDQFALEMDHMAQCVRENKRPRTPGEEGLQDHVLMEAIYRAAETGNAVRFDPAQGKDVTRGPEPEKPT